MNFKSGTTIGAYAFENCSTLTEIVVPGDVTSIGKGAFQGCENLVSISLPFVGKRRDATVYESVFGYIFGYTTDYTTSTYGSLSTEFVNKKYGSVTGAVWQYTCQNYKPSEKSSYYMQSYYYYIPSTLKEVTITNATKIPDIAFNGCSQLTNIELKEGIEGIGIYAFQNCTGITGIKLPQSLRIIQSYAFYNCTELTNIDFGGVNEISEYAFQKCSALTKLVVPNSVMTINAGAFKDCNSLASISLPFVGKSRESTAYEATLGYIFGYKTLRGNTYIQKSSTTFVNSQYSSVTGAVWQYSCNNYHVLSVGTSYYYLQSYFYYIPVSLREVEITDATKISDAAFNGCTELTSIVLNKGINEIGEYAFQNCTSLESIDYLGTVDDWALVVKPIDFNHTVSCRIE